MKERERDRQRDRHRDRKGYLVELSSVEGLGGMDDPAQVELPASTTLWFHNLKGFYPRIGAGEQGEQESRTII